MKINQILVFCFLMISSFSYGQYDLITFSGLILDQNTSDPISEVLIIQNNKIVGFTDINGAFKVKINLIDSDIVLIKHSSYKLVKHKINPQVAPTILLAPIINELDAIVIGGDDLAEDIISKASKQFDAKNRDKPYWALSNLKQVAKINDTLPSYLEGDYSLFMVGDDRDVWNLPILIPNEVRRTEEFIFDAINQREPEDYVFKSASIDYISGLFLTSYRFFEFGHPLSRKGRKMFLFHLEDTINRDGIEFYVISYQSIKDENDIKGRIFFDMKGEIVLEKETLLIKSVSSLHRRSTYNTNQGVDNIFTINYQQLNNQIYPKDISYNLKFKTPSTKLEVEGILSLHEINDLPVENYRKTISPNRYLFHSSKTYNNYNQSYWDKNASKPSFLEIKHFGSKIDKRLFENGANQKVTPIDLYPGTEENEKKLNSLIPKFK